MHLFFGLGSFLTPVFARPFLGNQGKVVTINIMEIILFKTSQDTLWTIDTLYGLLGGGLALNSLGYFVYYLVDLRKELREGSLKMEEGRKLDMVKEEETEASSAISLGARDRLLLVTLMTLFNFFFAGLEGTFKNLTPTFATASKLHLSRKQGADLSTIFFGTYTLNRWLHTNFRTEKFHQLQGVSDCGLNVHESKHGHVAFPWTLFHWLLPSSDPWRGKSACPSGSTSGGILWNFVD